jgi:hypothetical protein
MRTCAGADKAPLVLIQGCINGWAGPGPSCTHKIKINLMNHKTAQHITRFSVHV